MLRTRFFSSRFLLCRCLVLQQQQQTTKWIGGEWNEHKSRMTKNAESFIVPFVGLVENGSLAHSCTNDDSLSPSLARPLSLYVRVQYNSEKVQCWKRLESKYNFVYEFKSVLVGQMFSRFLPLRIFLSVFFLSRTKHTARSVCAQERERKRNRLKWHWLFSACTTLHKTHNKVIKSLQKSRWSHCIFSFGVAYFSVDFSPSLSLRVSFFYFTWSVLHCIVWVFPWRIVYDSNYSKKENYVCQVEFCVSSRAESDEVSSDSMCKLNWMIL